MPLEEYRRKRDFDITAEPRGEKPDGRPRLVRRFVVQRHRASRLHYDFRLEIGGVLVSWALPRGPSMRPLSKRRAARTEDHPIEYLDFEGIIPIGEYGGGDVIVWDQGTWEPEGLDEPAAAVEDGELKLVLHGQRLRGRFVLVRTHKENQSKEDWLLIHKQGEESDPFWDIRDYPTSVLSGVTNEQIATRRPPAPETIPAHSMTDIDLSAARQVPLPSFIPPMLATPVDRAFSDADWLFELKLDGYRVQAIVSGKAVKLRTRNGKDAATYFPAFAAAPAAWLGGYDAIVDGEMVALDESGRPDFGLLQDLAGMRGLGVHRGERKARAVDEPERKGSLVYHAFDLLHLDSWDLLAVPLEERKRLLRLVLREDPSVRYVSHVLEHGEEFQKAVIEQGLEGCVAKLRGSRYEPGKRTRWWLKIKARREQELVLVGYEPGKSSHRDLGSVLVATREVEGWRFAGQVGSGMDATTRKLLRQILDEHPLRDPPTPGVPRLPEARWSEPRHVIKAEFTEWTPDGLLRQATYKGREVGRDPATVSREAVEPIWSVRRHLDRGESSVEPPASAVDGRVEGSLTSAETAVSEDPMPVASHPEPLAMDGTHRSTTRAPDARRDDGRPELRRRAVAFELVREGGTRRAPVEAVTRVELAALSALAEGGRWHVGGHVVELTNLDKVLFPEARYTKRDLIRYYATIAPAILPYLRERPLNVHRWPDGVTGRTRFWQKQIPPHAPDWVARWDYPEAGHDQSHTYVVADHVATMAWLANNAAIDLHPWTSRLPEYWRPTYALVDIDPGESTTWPEVVTLARLYRTALGHLGVQGYPKVSGQRGIQVWIHVQPRYTFDETRDWVGELSRGVAAVVPDLVSWEWGKADRGGRARLDYTQNALIKTLVAPYAVRPVPTGAVSAPITWDELDDPTLRPGKWDLRSILERVETLGELFSGVLSDPQVLPRLS
jgi:bifunctional non-homologous end joining protein LigD